MFLRSGSSSYAWECSLESFLAASSDLPALVMRGTEWVDFPSRVGKCEADLLVSPREDFADVGLGDAVRFQGAAHRLEEFVEAFVDFLLVHVQALGDFGGFEGLPESEL